MARSTKADKARQLNAAYSLLQRHAALPAAVQRLSRQFALSERQAYRYLEEAAQLERPVEVTEATVPVTLKLPTQHSESTAEICEQQRPHYRSNRDTRLKRVSRCSEKAWLSRSAEAARCKSKSTMRLIACANPSSPRPIVFWCPVGSARWVNT
jgi:hypothetical protein